MVEKPTGSISFGAGVSSRDGFVISGALSDNNLFGRGYAASIGADIGGSNDRYFLNFAWPYFMDTNWGLSTQLSALSLEYEDFTQEQTGAELVLSHALDEAGTHARLPPLRLDRAADRGEPRDQRREHDLARGGGGLEGRADVREPVVPRRARAVPHGRR